ncbi:Hsp70 family protein [Parasulfuritortus cantonensis]|uniref:Hsp70 family protein n=1 Tax=Parasulfuritortus cantonensis TaxID=2528202 RepID=A0A4R1B5G6_9PROT|nr:Hsp70 family protein [Parasulfuritortus cantonensis]TCJ12740.1 Hsp70 family protein [Parasulfuritortus cantonensis]
MPRRPRPTRSARASAGGAIVAIDFGTSNSTAGYPSAAGPVLVPLEADHATIPSAIFFNTEDECIQFGRSAIESYTQHYEGRLLRALKSVLGSALIEETTPVGNQRIAFKDIIGLFLRHLKARAEAGMGAAAEAVVLGRPVHFVDDDDARDRAAQDQLEAIAREAGFKQVDFQYEPIAAALDYEAGIDAEELALIADLGGGTADISIVRVSPARHLKADRKADVLANAGVHIGGTDYDKRLSLDQVMPHLGYRSHHRLHPDRELPAPVYFDLATWHRIVLLNDNRTASLLKELHHVAAQPALVHRLARVIRERTGHQLAGDVETAKIALSDAANVALALPYVDDGLVVELSRAAFERATGAETEKIAASIHACLNQAGVPATAITTLFLTGGTSAIPSVRAACRASVPNARLVEGDRFGSVGLGLTIHAGVRAHG